MTNDEIMIPTTIPSHCASLASQSGTDASATSLNSLHQYQFLEGLPEEHFMTDFPVARVEVQKQIASDTSWLAYGVEPKQIDKKVNVILKKKIYDLE